nr:HINT domain-containing protein [Myxococcales bacterium]
EWTMGRTAPGIIEARFEGPDGTQTIEATEEHPFRIADSRQWMPLGEIRVGTELVGTSAARVVLTQKAWSEVPREVFNFEVVRRTITSCRATRRWACGCTTRRGETVALASLMPLAV